MSSLNENTCTEHSRRIPNGWVETTLGEVSSKMYSGGTPSTKKPEFYGGNIPWIRTQEVTFNFITETEIKITNDGLNKSSAKWIPKDTVIVAMYGNSAGRVALSKIEATTNQACCNFIANPNVSDSYFIFYNLLSRYKEIEGKANGAAQQNLSVGVLKDLTINLPPLPEQKAIANILTAFDDKIENLQAQNKTLEQTAQTIFAAWFGKYQVGDELPDGWRAGKLGEEFKITMGQSPSGSSYNEEGNGTVFFQGRAEFTSRFPDIRLYTTEPKRMANKFDVLVSVRAPVGDINVAHINCCIGRGLAAVSSKYKSYALYKLRSIKPVFDLFESEGTVFGSINKTSFENIETIIPPSVKVLEFDILSEKIDAKIYNNHNQIQTLKKTRDTLLPKLMSGQLRVKMSEL